MQCVYAKYNIFVTTSLPLCSHTVKIDYRNVKKTSASGTDRPPTGALATSPQTSSWSPSCSS